jgi:predicted aldo/keto reductase-like oxidoreductase
MDCRVDYELESLMEYRRFGRTEQKLSVITLGGMRYHDGWSKPRDQPHREMIEHCKRSIVRALSEGINHIETAHGYGKSEYCYGTAFEELGLSRDKFVLMTKGSAASGDEMRRVLDEQLTGLRTDKIELYGYHGINNAEILESVFKKGGPLEVLEEYRRQGVIGHIGFSTHGPTEVICRAVLTNRFDFVNLHYYYFWQRNYAAIQLAQTLDMGVFIISPNDKGGRLFDPPELLRKLTAPLTPIQWGARFCLRLPSVHTLSFGMNEPSHFDEMRGIFPTRVPFSSDDLRIQNELDQRLMVDPLSAYEGHELLGDPSGINIPEVLRFRRLLKCYDMEAFGKYRYNMFEGKGHWFVGHFATPENVALVDESRAPSDVPLKQMLAETHEALFRPR